MNGINSKRRTACGIIDAADLNSALWFLKEDAMILYDTRIPVSLEDFGIQIPLRDSRATRTFDTLRSDPRLGPKLHQWHVARIEERLSKTDLLRAHSRGYVEQLLSDQLEKAIVSTYELIDSNGQYHRYDPTRATRPLAELFQRILIKAAGSTQCGRLAIKHGFCYCFSGGMHHAHADHGSGFCLVNDVVIAARKLQAEKRVDRVWVIDVDAHKGDGSAAITATDPSIATLSIHMAHGWPLDGPPVMDDGTPNPAFIASDIDIAVAPGQESDYVENLGDGLARLDRLGPADLAIVVHGSDPYKGDELPSTRPLKLTLRQMLERDRLIYGFLKKRRVPAAYLMAGGYGENVWQVYSQFLLWVMAGQE